MRRIPRAATPTACRRALAYIAALAISACLASGFVYAATIWSMDAELQRAAATLSNSAAKQDRFDPAPSVVRPVQGPLTKHTRVLSFGEMEVMLRDPDGRVVYRHDPTAAETTITRGTQLPTHVGSIGRESLSWKN